MNGLKDPLPERPSMPQERELKSLSAVEQEFLLLQHIYSDDSSFKHRVPERLPLGYCSIAKVLNVLGVYYYPKTWRKIEELDSQLVKAVGSLESFVYAANEKLYDGSKVKAIRDARKWEYLLNLEKYKFHDLVRYTSIAKLMLSIFESGALKVRFLSRPDKINVIIPTRDWSNSNHTFLMPSYEYEAGGQGSKVKGIIAIKEAALEKLLLSLKRPEGSDEALPVSQQRKISSIGKVRTALNRAIEEAFCEAYNTEGRADNYNVWRFLKQRAETEQFYKVIQAERKILWSPPSKDIPEYANSMEWSTFCNLISKLKKDHSI